jgi:hypothetical protein
MNPNLKPYKPGQSGNPQGRPLGNRNRLSDRFIGDLLAWWEERGATAIKELDESGRADVLIRAVESIVRVMLPRQLYVRNESPFQGVSDDELNGMLRSVRQALADRAGLSRGTGSDAPPSSQQVN